MTEQKNIGCFQRWWRGCLVSLLFIMFVMFVSYGSWCWGIWGRGSRLMHYLLDCRCPAASEAARYRPLKVLVSACEEPHLTDVSPSGRYVLIFKRQPHLHLLHMDLATGQEQIIDQRAGYNFLTDTLLMARLREGALLVDLADGTRTSAIYVEDLYNTPPSEQVRQALQNAAQAYKLLQYFVVLAPDYKHSPQQNVVFYTGSHNWELLELILDEMDLTYTEVLPARQTGRVRGARYSHNGQLWADRDGIHLESTGELVVPTGQVFSDVYRSYGFGANRWVRNDQIVIYGMGAYSYLFGGGGFSPSFCPYPLPILLLEVPPEYWPAATATPMP